MFRFMIKFTKTTSGHHDLHVVEAWLILIPVWHRVCTMIQYLAGQRYNVTIRSPDLGASVTIRTLCRAQMSGLL